MLKRVSVKKLYTTDDSCKSLAQTLVDNHGNGV